MESSLNTLQSYVLALLTLMGNLPGADTENPPLGTAIRLFAPGSQTTYYQPAHTLLQALIEHSPSPETVAQQFLTELIKCENSVVQELGDVVSTLCDLFYVKYYAQVGYLDGDRSRSPDGWAADVNNELNENARGLSSVTDLASYYLTHLVIASRVQCNTCSS